MKTSVSVLRRTLLDAPQLQPIVRRPRARQRSRHDLVLGAGLDLDDALQRVAEKVSEGARLDGMHGTHLAGRALREG